MKKQKIKRGFTLIELIIVIAILVVLLLILAPKLNGFSKEASDVASLTNLKTVERTYYEAVTKVQLIDKISYPDKDEEVIIIPGGVTDSDKYPYDHAVTRIMADVLGEGMNNKFTVYVGSQKSFITICYYPQGRGTYPYFKKQDDDYYKCETEDKACTLIDNAG